MFSQLRLNHLSYFAAVAVNGLANFSLIALLVRTFHADQYSVLVLAGTALSFSFLLDMGIGLAVTRSVAESVGDQDVARSSRQVAVASFLYDGIGVASAIVLAGFPIVLGPLFPFTESQRVTFNHVMWITALQSLISFHYAVWGSVAMGFQRHAIVHITNSLATLAKLGGAAAVCVLIPSPEMISASYAIVALAAGFTLRLLVKKHCMSPAPLAGPPSRAELFHVARISFSTSVGSVAGKVVTESDRFAIGLSSPGSTLAQYDVMLSLANFTRHILYSATQLIAAFARLRSSAELRSELLVAASGICFGSYLTLFAFILLWGDVIVRTWVGASFLAMLPALYCLVGATLIQSVSAPSHFLLVGISDLTFYRQIHLVQIAAKILLTAGLLMFYGAIGVALSTMAAYLITEIAVLNMAAKLSNLSLMKLISKILLLGSRIAAAPIAVLALLEFFGGEHTLLNLLIAGALMVALLVPAIYRLGISDSLRRGLETAK